ncbi:MAG: MerC domain-containing protein [Myxococcota bacterium]
MNETTTDMSGWADRAGRAGSAVCVVHCLLGALVPGVLGIAGLSSAALVSLEWGFVLFAVGIAAFSAVNGYRRHRSLWVSGCLIGLALILLTVVPLEHLVGHTLGLATAVIAGTGLIVTHTLSARAQTGRHRNSVAKTTS